ncbi:hypothetical protein L2E82_25061 [Cichorium intybus]|uniref:Uncharacterized protein n=1 Tax=Cichorium intybus TaxID=13427 RepID=A0ACB9E2J3_CICIN|nr:hypothetical protein L2E82_25061 [Cichorium intybus]
MKTIQATISPIKAESKPDIHSSKEEVDFFEKIRSIQPLWHAIQKNNGDDLLLPSHPPDPTCNLHSDFPIPVKINLSEISLGKTASGHKDIGLHKQEKKETVMGCNGCLENLSIYKLDLFVRGVLITVGLQYKSVTNCEPLDYFL